MDDLPRLIAGCASLLADDASFLLLNAYSERLTGLALAGLMGDALGGRGGMIDWGELALIEEYGAARRGPARFSPAGVRRDPGHHLARQRYGEGGQGVASAQGAGGERGLFLAEGLKIVSEAVSLGRAPRILLHAAEAERQPLLAAARAVAGETLRGQPRGPCQDFAAATNPQTVLGVFVSSGSPTWSPPIPGAARCWVALQQVRDPGNLGTVVRIADAAGCWQAVILVGDCCDPYSVEAVRASMGSIFAVPIAKAGIETFLACRRARASVLPGTVAGTTLSAPTDFRAAAYRRIRPWS